MSDDVACVLLLLDSWSLGKASRPPILSSPAACFAVSDLVKLWKAGPPAVGLSPRDSQIRFSATTRCGAPDLEIILPLLPRPEIRQKARKETFVFRRHDLGKASGPYGIVESTDKYIM